MRKRLGTLSAVTAALVTLGSKAPYAVAITGGSGKYQGAAGEVYVHPVSDTHGILTFNLKQ